MSIRVYRYGCGRPLSGWEYAQAEQERCTQLWDALVELDRAIEGQTLQAAALDDPAIMRANEGIAQLTARLAEDPDDKAVREERRGLYAERRAALTVWNRAHKTVLREYELRRQAGTKLARQQSAAWWPNQNRVLQAYEAARQLCRKSGRRLHLYDVDRDDGVLAYQIQRTRSTQVERVPDPTAPKGFRIVSSDLGAAPEELQDGTVAAIQIGRVDPRAYDRATCRGERDRLHQTILEMRVDADGHTLRLPVWMHRPLPAECRVKAAQITWYHRAARLHYQLCLTIAIPDVPLRVACEAATAARLTFHWVREGGLKVLSLEEPDHAPSLWALSPRWLAKADLAARKRWEIEETIAAARERYEDDPRWGDLFQERSYLAMFGRLQASWASLPSDIQGWYRQLRHSWKFCEGLRAHLLGERRQLYRSIAREIVSRYPVIEVPDTSFAEVATAERGSPANSDRHLAAPHLLRQEILHQAAKVGTLIVAPGEVASAPRLGRNGDGRSARWLRLKNLARERSRASPGASEYAGV